MSRLRFECLGVGVLQESWEVEVEEMLTCFFVYKPTHVETTTSEFFRTQSKSAA